MTRETLTMTREDSDSRLMTCDSTWDSAPRKINDSRLGKCDSRLDSHDSCTALLTRLQNSFSVTEMVGNWITSYLTDHSQFIHVDQSPVLSPTTHRCAAGKCVRTHRCAAGKCVRTRFSRCLFCKHIRCVSQSVCTWHTTVRCLIEKGRQWCSHQLSKQSVRFHTWFSQNVLKRTRHQPGKIWSDALVNYTAC